MAKSPMRHVVAIAALVVTALVVTCTVGCTAQPDMTNVELTIEAPNSIRANERSTFTATTTVTGGTVPFSYAYTGTPTWQGAGSSATLVLSWSTPGKYDVTCVVNVTDANGKTRSATITSRVTVTADQGRKESIPIFHPLSYAVPLPPRTDTPVAYEPFELFVSGMYTLSSRPLDWQSKNDATGKVWRTFESSLGTLDPENQSAVQYRAGFAYFVLSGDAFHLYACGQASKPVVVLTITGGSLSTFSVSPDGRWVVVGSREPTVGDIRTLYLWSFEQQKVITSVKSDPREGYWDQSPAWGGQGWWAMSHVNAPYWDYTFTAYTSFMPAVSSFVQFLVRGYTPDEASVSRYPVIQPAYIPLEAATGSIDIAFDPWTGTVAYYGWDKFLDRTKVAPELYLYDISTGKTRIIDPHVFAALQPVYVEVHTLEYSTTRGANNPGVPGHYFVILPEASVYPSTP